MAPAYVLSIRIPKKWLARGMLQTTGLVLILRNVRAQTALIPGAIMVWAAVLVSPLVRTNRPTGVPPSAVAWAPAEVACAVLTTISGKVHRHVRLRRPRVVSARRVVVVPLMGKSAVV